MMSVLWVAGSVVKPDLCRADRTAFNRDAVHDSSHAAVIVLRPMPGRPIIPECNRSGAPLEFGHKRLIHRDAIEVLEQGPRLVPRLQPSIPIVKPGFTKRALRPLRGCSIRMG